MENFENSFRQNLSNEEEGLTPFEEAQLWDSIVDELGPLDSIPADTEGLNLVKWGLPFIAFSLLLFICTLHLVQFDNTAGISYVDSSEVEAKNLSAEQMLEQKSSIKSPESVTKDKKAIVVSNESTDDVSPLDDLTNDLQNKQPSKLEIDTDTARPAVRPKKYMQDGDIEIAKESSIEPDMNGEPDNQSTVSREDLAASKSGTGIPAIIEAESAPIEGNREEVAMDNNTTSEEELANYIPSDASSNAVETALESGPNKHTDNPDAMSYQPLVVTDGTREDIDFSTIKIPHFGLFDLNVPIVNSELKRAKKKLVFDIGLNSAFVSSGIDYFGSNSDLVTRKNQTETGYYGYSVGIDISTVFRNKWIIHSGLVYQVQKSIFDESIYKDISVDRKYTTGILVNQENYELIDEFELDTVGVYSSLNRVRNVNSFSSVVIPVQFGWKSPSSRLSYGILVGANIRIRTGQSGKLISLEQELSTLDNGSNLFYNSINIGLAVTPFLQYNLSPISSLQLSYQLAAYRPTISVDQTIMVTNYTNSFQIGFRYRL